LLYFADTHLNLLVCVS